MCRAPLWIGGPLNTLLIIIGGFLNLDTLLQLAHSVQDSTNPSQSVCGLLIRASPSAQSAMPREEKERRGWFSLDNMDYVPWEVGFRELKGKGEGS